MKKTALFLAAAILCGCVSAAEYQDGKEAMKAAEAFEKAQKREEAVQAYREAAKLFTKPVDQFNALSKAVKLMSSDNSRKAEALELLRTFAENEKNPLSQRTLAFVGCAKIAPSQEEAIRFLDQGMALKAGDWTEGACALAKGEIFIKQKKTAEAEAVYKQTAEKADYNEITRATAYSRLADIAAGKKDYAAAHVCCAEIRKLGEKRYAFLREDADFQEAKIFISERKQDEALKLLSALAADPKARKQSRSSAIESVVRLEYDRNRIEEAKKALELFKTYGLPPTNGAKRIEKEIKDLTE